MIGAPRSPPERRRTRWREEWTGSCGQACPGSPRVHGISGHGGWGRAGPMYAPRTAVEAVRGPMRVPGTVGRVRACERLLVGRSSLLGQLRQPITAGHRWPPRAAATAVVPGAVDCVALPAGSGGGGGWLVRVAGSGHGTGSSMRWGGRQPPPSGSRPSRPHGPPDGGPGTATPGCRGRWGRRGASGADDGPRTRPGEWMGPAGRATASGECVDMGARTPGQAGAEGRPPGPTHRAIQRHGARSPGPNRPTVPASAWPRRRPGPTDPPRPPPARRSNADHLWPGEPMGRWVASRPRLPSGSGHPATS
jgi:hypothetical protein